MWERAESRKDNRPPAGGRPAFESRSSRRGAVAGSVSGHCPQPGCPMISDRPCAGTVAREGALRLSDREAKQAVPGPWPASRQSVPGRDRRFQAITVSSLTGSVFQPTWIVSAVPGVHLQRFCRSSASASEVLLGKTLPALQSCPMGVSPLWKNVRSNCRAVDCIQRRFSGPDKGDHFRCLP